MTIVRLLELPEEIRRKVTEWELEAARDAKRQGKGARRRRVRKPRR